MSREAVGWGAILLSVTAMVCGYYALWRIVYTSEEPTTCIEQGPDDTCARYSWQ